MPFHFDSRPEAARAQGERRYDLWMVVACLLLGTALFGASLSSAAYSDAGADTRPQSSGVFNPLQGKAGQGGIPGAFPMAGPTCTPGTWSAQAPYPAAAAGMAIAAHGGSIYAFGGFTGAAPTAASYRYDPGANSWTPIASLPSARAAASAVSDGTYIYILGGGSILLTPSNNLWRYNPATNSYTTLAAYSTATAAHAAAYLDGNIYRIGGCFNLTCDSTATVERYSVSGGTWTAAPAYPIPVGGLAATTHGGAIYAAGGITLNTTETVKTYRFDGTTWDDAGIADLPEARYLAAGSVYNGKWLLAGGTSAGVALDSVVAWDPGADAWAGLPNLPTARYYVGGAAAGGAFYAIAGFDNAGTVTTDNQRYLEAVCGDTPTPTMVAATSTPTATVTPADPTPSNTTEPGPTSTGTPTVAASNTPVPPTSTPTVEVTNTPAPPTGTATPCPMTFTDVLPTDYFYEPVRYLYCRGVISGYGDNTFRPYNNTTRGQLAKIVVAAEGWPIDTTGGPHFNDVAQDNPFYGFIETAFNREIISGYGCGGPGEPCPGLYFRWGNNVTRGQLSKIVVGAEGWPIDTTGGPHFTDVPATDPFYEVIETAFNRAIISGYADGTFRPGSNATRGQIAKIVYQAVTQP